MKKSKIRKKLATTRKAPRPAKPLRKIARGKLRVPKAAAAGLIENSLLAEAIADLAAITAELRGIATDLRDLMGESEETGPGVEAVVISEIESPESAEEESL